MTTPQGRRFQHAVTIKNNTIKRVIFDDYYEGNKKKKKIVKECSQAFSVLWERGRNPSITLPSSQLKETSDLLRVRRTRVSVFQCTSGDRNFSTTPPPRRNPYYGGTEDTLNSRNACISFLKKRLLNCSKKSLVREAVSFSLKCR